MRIHVLSDLHLEFGDFDPPDTHADVVVLAGDTSKHTHGLEWSLSKFHSTRQGTVQPAIIYVIGNHEFYGAEMEDVRRELKKQAELARRDGIRAWVLDNDTVEINGVLFLGATLWTDYKLFGEGSQAFAMREAERGLNDHQLIRCAPLDRFNASQALQLHYQSAAWLASKLATPSNAKRIVVTHHLPSMESVAERFTNDPLSAAFASRLDFLVAKADLWIHGHTHDSFDYELSGTRVICNPRGYLDENPNFNPALVIRI